MTLHDRDGFTGFVSTLRAVTLHEQWEALVAKVGGKVFCLLGDSSGDIVFRVGEIAFDGLTELDGIEQAAYFRQAAMGAGFTRGTRDRPRARLHPRVAPTDRRQADAQA